jgi:hypothetical protein
MMEHGGFFNSPFSILQFSIILLWGVVFLNV